MEGTSGSGGVFTPSLYVGVMLGAFLAKVFHQSVPAFAVVGMAAVFGGAARVPIATLLMVTEMTDGGEFKSLDQLAILIYDHYWHPEYLSIYPITND